jgi:hypothetical protein
MALYQEKSAIIEYLRLARHNIAGFIKKYCGVTMHSKMPKIVK